MRKGDTLKGDSICDFLLDLIVKGYAFSKFDRIEEIHTLHIFKTIICCKRREILMFKNLFSMSKS